MRKLKITSLAQIQKEIGWSPLIQQQQQSFGFDDSPNFGTIVPALAWISSYVLTGTLTSGANTVTAITNPPGTAGLAVGQPVSGTGVAPGATITQIVSATAVNLSLNSTASGAQTLTFALFNPSASPFAFASPFSPFPNPLGPATAGGAFNQPDVQVLAAGTTYVPAPGRGVCVITSGTTAATIQYNINTVWTNIFVGTASASSPFYLMADGQNVRWNSPTVSSTFTFYRELSSKS